MTISTIVQRLLDEDLITAEEAVVLLRGELQQLQDIKLPSIPTPSWPSPSWPMIPYPNNPYHYGDEWVITCKSNTTNSSTYPNEIKYNE